ncbi:MAG: hypothetical protein JO130_01465 [Solirubrobacterales bacterium]|nr:hypothetical protein [Solirubrobacterales bacterium]
MAANAHQAARIMAAGRVLIGATMLAAPDLVAAPWVGEDARTPGARVIVRALGARDAVLGAGTLAAGDRAEVRRWLIASSASDAADFVATLAGPRSPARAAVLAVAAAATVTGLAAAASV